MKCWEFSNSLRELSLRPFIGVWSKRTSLIKTGSHWVVEILTWRERWAEIYLLPILPRYCPNIVPILPRYDPDIILILPRYYPDTWTFDQVRNFLQNFLFRVYMLELNILRFSICKELGGYGPRFSDYGPFLTLVFSCVFKMYGKMTKNIYF